MVARVLDLIRQHPGRPYADLLAEHEIPYELLLLPGHGVFLEENGECHWLRLPKVTEAPSRWGRCPPGTVVRHEFRDGRVQDKIIVGKDDWALVLVPLGIPFDPKKEGILRAPVPVAA